MTREIQMSSKTPEYPEKLVYGTVSYDGIRFALGVSGAVYASARDVSVRKVAELTFQDSGKPWIPRHKNFNALCRQMLRDGDVDEVVAEYQKQRQARHALKKAAPDLLQAAQRLFDLANHFHVGDVWFSGSDENREALEAMEAAIAKAET